MNERKKNISEIQYNQSFNWKYLKIIHSVSNDIRSKKIRKGQ